MEKKKESEEGEQGRKRQMEDDTQTSRMDEIAKLEELARKEGGISRRQSLPRTPEKKAKRPKTTRSPINKETISTIMDILNKSITVGTEIEGETTETENDEQTDSNDERRRRRPQAQVEEPRDKISEFFSRTTKKTTEDTHTTGQTHSQTTTGATPKIRPQDNSEQNRIE